MQEILIRWMIYKKQLFIQMGKDVQHPETSQTELLFSKIHMEKGLDSTKLSEEKVVKTLIQGVKSSGNQAEQRLCQRVKLLQKEFPQVNRIIKLYISR